MKKLLAFLLVLGLVLMNSCQRETSFESGDSPSEGLLQSNVTGDCFPKTVAGAYVQGTALNSTTNFISVDVLVTAPGSYTISSDTANGVHFLVSGTFTSTGINTVKVKGIGTPFGPGAFNFTIKYDAQICFVLVTFLPTGAGGPAVFTLTGSPSACTGAVVAGSYAVGLAMTSANTATIGVNVTAIGTYTISTSFQGMIFNATGTFASIGPKTVILNGSGIPTTAGVNTVPITVGTSTCSFPVTVGNIAVGSLGGGPGACTPATVSGTYTAGTPLIATNTVQIQVTVTTPGVYTITTNTQNGVSFTTSGTFAANGPANVTLTGTGTPAASGPFTFIITFGSSTCTFPITFAAAPPTDYFPRTANSNWSYDFDDVFDDSVLIKATAATHSVPPNTYNIFKFDDGVTVSPDDTSGYYRKAGGQYFRYVNLADYFQFDDDQFVEFTFLRDDQAAGFTWTTAGYTGAVGGTPGTFRIKFTILQKDVPVTVNGTPYPNTIVIEEKYEINIAGIWTSLDTAWGYYKDYYSRNVGWILDEYIDPTVGTTPVGKMELRRFQVF
jgi:hypothetical protein